MKARIAGIIAIIIIGIGGCTSVDNTISSPGYDPNRPVSNEPNATPEDVIPEDVMPRKEDQKLMRGNVYLESIELLTLESYPPQYMLHVTGQTPTPCHMLRIDVQPPNNDGDILVDIYSVTDPTAICAQVLAPFDRSIPIKADQSGTFKVIAYGEDIGEITIP